MGAAAQSPAHVLETFDVTVADFTALQSEELFLVLDGARIDGPRFIYENDDCPETDVLYRDTPHETVVEVSPCIVRPSHNSQLRERLDGWRAHGVAIEATADFLTVGNHLRSLLSVRMPDGAFAYLRFYSPGQIEPLFSSFSAQELRKFSGPIKRWHYYSPVEGWKTVEVPGIGESQEAPNEGWFQLSADHINAIEAGNETAFRKKLVHQAGWSITSESMSRIDQIIARARSFGFQTQSDIATYAELACYYGERLEEPNALAVLKSEDHPAGQRLEIIDSMMSYGDA